MDGNGDICIETECPDCSDGTWTGYQRHYKTKEVMADEPIKCGLCNGSEFVKQLTRYPFPAKELNNVVLDEVKDCEII